MPTFRYEWPGHSRDDVSADPSQWWAPPPGYRWFEPDEPMAFAGAV